MSSAVPPQETSAPAQAEPPPPTGPPPAEKVKEFPAGPGVYLMKDEQGRVLYVGKAKNLRNRAGHYFTKAAAEDRRTADLVKLIADIDYLPAEARHLRGCASVAPRRSGALRPREIGTPDASGAGTARSIRTPVTADIRRTESQEGVGVAARRGRGRSPGGPPAAAWEPLLLLPARPAARACRRAAWSSGAWRRSTSSPGG
jgi:hypothetical protein